MSKQGKGKSYWSVSKPDLLAATLKAYHDEEQIGQTVRHYYYKLLSAGAIRLLPDRANSGENAYKAVVSLLTDARMEGVLGWETIVDPGRRAFTYFGWNLKNYLRASQRSTIQVDVWRGQPQRLEMWVEKDGLASFAHHAISDYRVPVHVAKGYGSATIIKDAAERYGTGENWTILYAGDFDPSGLDIERCLRDTLRCHGARPEIVRVALTQADTRRLPQEAALDVKKSDSRAAGFIRLYGPDQKGFELDAMPAGQLRRRLIDAVLARMDIDTLQEALAIERATDRVIEDHLSGVFGDLHDRILGEGFPDNGLSPTTVQRYLADRE